MKSYKFYFLALISFLILSCGDSDKCEQVDWVGTYSGTLSCLGNEAPTTVTIVANGTNRLQISYERPAIIKEFTQVLFDGCSINSPSNSLTAELNGENLTFTEVFFDGSSNIVCTVNVVRD